MTRLWRDAAGILETAAAAGPEGADDLAIVVDAESGLHIVCEPGLDVDALQREYSASEVYTVTRTAACITVDAQSGTDRCTFRKNSAVDARAILARTIPHHLV